MCNLNVVLQCEKYIDVRRNLKKYYWQLPSCFKLIQLLSVHNIKELNNLGKYLLLAEKKLYTSLLYEFVTMYLLPYGTKST